ncbi:MAG: DMT family transporter [Actinomycetota bacterium]
MSSERSTPAGLAGSTIAVVCWAAGNVMVVRAPMDGLQIAFWRIFLGAVVFTAIVYASGRRLDRQMVRAVAPAGVVISLEIAVFFVAIRASTVANATVISNLTPIVLLAVAARAFQERVTGLLVAVTGVSLVGVVLVVFGSTQHTSWQPVGDLLAFVAMFLFAAYFATAKRGRETVPILEFQACLWIVGTVVLFPVAVVDAGGVDVPSWHQWGWLAALLAVPGTGHMLMNWSHSHVRLVITSMLTLAIPVMSTIGAVLFLDETVNGLQILGMAVTLGALALVVRREAELHPT